MKMKGKKRDTVCRTIQMENSMGWKDRLVCNQVIMYLHISPSIPQIIDASLPKVPMEITVKV